MRFSVVIPTYNRWATLRQTLTALQAQTYAPHEIIVVDDGSRDATPTALPQTFPHVHYVRQQNAGPATARNHGIQRATGEFIAFTDDDCLPPPNWLEKLADGFQRYPQVIGVGGPLLAAPAVRQTNLLAQYEAYIVQSLYHARDQEMLGSFDCPAGGTNNLAYRKTVLEQVGGFDATFPYAAAEDAELKWRLTRQGEQLLYLPVTMTHLQPYTWPTFRQQQFTRGKGSVYFDRKWRTVPSRAKIIARGVSGWARWLWRAPRLPRLVLLRPALEETWQVTRGQWAALTEIQAKAQP